ncbi:UNVERIFIED_CONTAM: hypothetical protein O8I53_06395 [Campylobacter lari]
MTKTIQERKRKFEYLVKKQILNQDFLNTFIKKNFDENNNFTIVFAKNDHYVTEKQINDILKHRPEINSYLIGNCGHAIIYQKAEEINSLINNIINNII